MTTVTEYQDAFRKHHAAHKLASDTVQQVYNVSNALSANLRSFMGFNFNTQIDRAGGRYDPKARVDVKQWPGPEQLESVLKAWNEADSELRAAWEDLPPDDRVGLTSPPREMQLSASRY